MNLHHWHSFWFFLIREKLQELNNELLKKNAFIDEMEPKYNTSCEFGALFNFEVHL